MKKWIALAALVLLVLAGIYLGSPVMAARALHKAALAGDSQAIAAGVDFPSVRDSLAPQLSAAVEQKVRRRTGMDAGAAIPFANLVLPGLAKAAVDTFVTPEAIAALMRGRRPGDQDGADPDLDRNAGYEGLDHFRVRLTDTRRNRAGPSFLFERRGFAAWKLVRVDLPPRWLADSPSR